MPRRRRPTSSMMGPMVKARYLVMAGVMVIVLAQGQPAPGAGADLDEEIAALIEDLGAESYQVRERATNRLWEIGRPAIPALAKATGSRDLEVSMRADIILRDLRAGVDPGWPPEIIAAARRMQWCPAAQRRANLDRIVKALKGGALPFLLARLTAGDAKDKAHALGCIRKLAASEAKIYPRIIELLKQPANEYQGQALILARVHTGDTIAALKLMSRYDVGSSERRKIISKAVSNIAALVGRYKFEQAAKEAGEFAQAAPTDARFPYLQAEAVSALGEDGRAAALRAKALALNPGSEAAHYTAGEMLQHKLGRRTLAEKEWLNILSMPPHDQVYDMNALIRLHSIYAECGLFERSAERLEKAVDLVEAARKRSSGVGIAGASIPSLRKRIEGLHARARREPPGKNAKVRDRRPDNEIGMNIRVAVKDGKLRQLREALGKAAATLTVKIQPRGLRLFDKKVLKVRYDPGKGEVGVYLNDSPCCKPAPLRLAGKDARIAIRSLDCCYIYEIPAAGGAGRRVARFEKDYKLILRPGNKIAACRDIAVTINGKPYKWKDLLSGAAFDYLPEKFDVSIKGKHPSGRPLEMKFNIVPAEPPIGALPAQ